MEGEMRGDSMEIAYLVQVDECGGGSGRSKKPRRRERRAVERELERWERMEDGVVAERDAAAIRHPSELRHAPDWGAEPPDVQHRRRLGTQLLDLCPHLPVDLAQRRPRKATEGHGRPWKGKAMAGHGRPRKAMEGPKWE